MKWNDYCTKVLANLDNESFFISELKNVSRRGHEAKAECPFKDFHENSVDNTPSFTVNLLKGLYYCQTCHSRGNAHSLYKHLYKLTNDEAWFQIGDRLNIERPSDKKQPKVDSSLIMGYHKDLMQLTGPIRDVLKTKRGFTDETLKRFSLGWDGERVTIPIYDEFNVLANFRKYQWNSTDDKWKVLNYTDEFGNAFGEVRIFGIENLVENFTEYVIWSEGETDRILAEQYGFPTCCATSGAGTFKQEWMRYFRGKRVYIMQDNDDAGRSATAKLCERLDSICDVYTVNWPKDFPAKGDITDFFTIYKGTKEGFQKLLDDATLFSTIVENTEDAIEVTLAESSNAVYQGKRLKIPVMVSGKDNAPYLCPKVIKANCAAFDNDDKKCWFCTLSKNNGEIITEVKSSNKDILKLIKCNEVQQINMICEVLGLNNKCGRFTLDILHYMNIEELRLIPKTDATFGFQKMSEYVVRTGYYIGSDLSSNKRYTLSGHMYPDPKTQFATCLFDTATPDKDVVSSFSLTKEVYEKLKIFQPTESIKDKFDEIHQDLERNVTYVWQRREVSTAVDLVFHTALHFNFQGQFIKKGWGELLIIGDSGQAKTTLVEKMMIHYKLGEVHSGESAKRTGLVYSTQQNGSRWFLVWGALPLNDGGLVTIDELSGLDETVLSVMSDIRSSGIAKVTGVITSETTARTRLIFISNPRNGRQLNAETHGVNAILKLFGKAEDVRRLDLAVTVASGDVDANLVNQAVSAMPDVEHTYTSELCNLRALWAWSRTPDDIIITKEATKLILELAVEMGQKYSSTVPLVEAADQRLKIARLSIGCAACMFSTTNGNDLIVEPKHVEFVVNFMHEVYSKKSMGYDLLSDIDKGNSSTSEDRMYDLRKQFLRLPNHDHNELAAILYGLPYFSRSTLEDYTGLCTEELKSLLKFLTTNNIVEKYKIDYRRLPLGTTFLEDLVNNKITNEEIALARKGYYNEY